MARIRTVKPEFFKHEELYLLEIKTKLPLRVAFSGLWCCCDREGRFKWKPNVLKLDVLPFDNVDFSKVLSALEDEGFVIKYENDGSLYGFVPTFLKHQVINNRESISFIPNPYESTILTRASRVDNASFTPLPLAHGERKGLGKEEEGNTEIPPIFSKFYDTELASNESSPQIEGYKTMLEWMHKKDSSNDCQLKNVLKINKQISYENFVELKKIEGMFGTSLKKTLESLENKSGKDKNGKMYASVYLTMRAWLKPLKNEQ